jgi:hypothetical protein
MNAKLTTGQTFNLVRTGALNLSGRFKPSLSMLANP